MAGGINQKTHGQSQCLAFSQQDHNERREKTQQTNKQKNRGEEINKIADYKNQVRQKQKK